MKNFKLIALSTGRTLVLFRAKEGMQDDIGI